MKPPVKVLVVLALFGTVDAGVVARNAAATQPRSNAMVLSAQANSS